MLKRRIKQVNVGILLLVIMSIFDNNIMAAIPRPEYPRPQFERETWINLNGTWDYVFDLVGSGIERGYEAATSFEGKITVPFCPESQLSGIGYTDFIPYMWYHRVLDIPLAWQNKDILLNFGAVYNEAEIYIDGQFVGRHFGGSTSFSVDLTPYVQPGSTHHLVVYVSSDVRSVLQGAGKQSLCYASKDCNYTRTTGIWQTVWMEAVDPAGLMSVHTVTDIDQQQLVIYPRFRHESENRLQIEVYDGSKIVSKADVAASNSSVAVLPIRNVKLWSPESPFLYDIHYRVIDSHGEVIDEVRSYVGMRKIHIEDNKIYLNNKPYYQRLVLDQGFYLDGIWTAPTDEALKRDIELGKQAGFNGARLHQKAFEERYHYWADKLGYLTWGEMACWGMDLNNPVAGRNFLSEWRDLIIRDRNHPSIVIWTPLNEQFWPDRYHYPRLVADVYDLTKQLDPTRPVNDVSGAVHVKTDLWTIHCYEQDPDLLRVKIYDRQRDEFYKHQYWPQVPMYNTGCNQLPDKVRYEFPEYDGQKPFIVDEFGGIKWSSDQSQQVGNDNTMSWGYGNAPQTMAEFYARLKGQVDAVLVHGDKVGGYCYTQLTDVEQEQNGIYNYDRTPKFNMQLIREIFNRTPEDFQKDSRFESNSKF